MNDHILLLKALGDATRLKIVKLLLSQEFCVCELQELLGISQPAVSQHVSKLKQIGLVTERRAGMWTYYQADRPRLHAAYRAFGDFLAADLGSLPSMANEVEKLTSINRVTLCETVKE
jgi:ArsR family transcriptional regulator